jgi:hypothetical protein
MDGDENTHTYAWVYKSISFHVYTFTCYICTKSFHEKIDLSLRCVENTKFCVENNGFCETSLVFFKLITKNMFFCGTVRTHIDCGDVHAKKMLQFFTIINIFSGWRERIYHGAKLNFYYEK